MEHKLEEAILDGTPRDVQLEQFIVCTQCPNFSTTSQVDLSYHIAKKHSASQPKVTHDCQECDESFPSFYSLRQHKNQHKDLRKKEEQELTLQSLKIDSLNNKNLQDEIQSCKHFLVDSEIEKARLKVFNYAIETLSTKIVGEQLDHVFKKLNCAAKVNLAFGFILKNIEDGRFRYFYAHENNTLLDRSKLVCAKDDLTKLKDILNKTDIIESCSRERMNTKWRFYKLTNLTVFAALLKDVPMGWKDAVLPKPLLKNHAVNCRTFEENTKQPYNDNLCLFRALALHLHGNQKLEEKTSKIFNSFMNRMDGLTPPQFQGVHMNDIPVVEDLLHLNIFLYEIDIVDGKIIGELARRSVQKYRKTVRMLRYNNHICYVSNINAVFQSFRCSNCDTFFNRTSNLERHLTLCSERLKHVYPKNVYQIRETLFDKLNSFGIEYTKEQTLFTKLSVFDFESICVQDESFKDTDTKEWIAKHIPISISISSNLVEQPIFLCNADPHYLIASFIAALKNLASHSKVQMKTLFLDIETAKK